MVRKFKTTGITSQCLQFSMTVKADSFTDAVKQFEQYCTDFDDELLQITSVLDLGMVKEESDNG